MHRARLPGRLQRRACRLPRRRRPLVFLCPRSVQGCRQVGGTLSRLRRLTHSCRGGPRRRSGCRRLGCAQARPGRPPAPRLPPTGAPSPACWDKTRSCCRACAFRSLLLRCRAFTRPRQFVSQRAPVARRPARPACSLHFLPPFLPPPPAALGLGLGFALGLPPAFFTPPFALGAARLQGAALLPPAAALPRPAAAGRWVPGGQPRRADRWQRTAR